MESSSFFPMANSGAGGGGHRPPYDRNPPRAFRCTEFGAFVVATLVVAVMLVSSEVMRPNSSPHIAPLSWGESLIHRIHQNALSTPTTVATLTTNAHNRSTDPDPRWVHETRPHPSTPAEAARHALERQMGLAEALKDGNLPPPRVVFGMATHPALDPVIEELIGECDTVARAPPLPERWQASPTAAIDWIRAHISASWANLSWHAAAATAAADAKGRGRHKGGVSTPWSWPTLYVTIPAVVYENGTGDGRRTYLEWFLHNLPPRVHVDLVVLRESMTTSLLREVSPLFLSEDIGKYRSPAYVSSTEANWIIERLLDRARTIERAIESLSRRRVYALYRHTLGPSDQHPPPARSSHQAQEPGAGDVFEVRAEDLPHLEEGQLVRWLNRELNIHTGMRRVPAIPPLPAFIGGEAGGNRRDPEATALECILAWLARQDSPEKLQGIPALPHLQRWRGSGANATRPAKVVVIAQLRNVRYTLEGFLKSAAWLADRILLLDTGSTDGTVEWVHQNQRQRRRGDLLGKVELRALPPATGDQYRWNSGENYATLVSWAREEGGTHMVFLDSDEYLTANWRRRGLLRNVILALPPATAIEMRRFHVYEGINQWIVRAKENWGQDQHMAMAWCDDGEAYPLFRSHHIPRVPKGYRRIKSLVLSPLLGAVHFKFASMQAMRIKTVWYLHMEFSEGKGGASTEQFYLRKEPSEEGLVLEPVPLGEWYGDGDTLGTNAARQWLNPEAWAWRVETVRRWRADWRARKVVLPKYLAKLPPDWPKPPI